MENALEEGTWQEASTGFAKLAMMAIERFYIDW